MHAIFRISAEPLLRWRCSSVFRKVLSMKTASGGQYVPSLFLRPWKLTAVLMPMEASTAAITVVGTCMSSQVLEPEFLGHTG